jgi:hypothetical protein
MHATFLLVSTAYYRGRWNEMQPDLEEHLSAFAQIPHDRCPLVRGAPALGALTLAQMGDAEGAAELARLAGYDPGRPETGDGILARYAVAAGDPETARRIAESILSATDDPDATLALVEAMLAMQDWEGLAEFVPSARGMVDAMALLGPVCDRAEGLAEAAAGKRWAATELLKGALGAFERLSVPFEAARTREALAGIALPEEARDYLEHAVATYQRLGAIPASERARAQLRALDEPSPPQPGRPPANSWPGSWSDMRRAGS